MDYFKTTRLTEKDVEKLLEDYYTEKGGGILNQVNLKKQN